MVMTQYAKQTLGFQKTILENSFNVMNSVQDQTEKMVNSYLDQMPWVTADGKKSLQTSLDMAKKFRDNFKKSIDDGYCKIEELLEEKKQS